MATAYDGVHEDARQALEDKVSDLSRLLVTDETVQSTLGHVVDLAVRAIPACDAAGVMVYEQEQLRTAAASAPLVRRVDALQYMAKEGPCLDTLRTGETSRTSLDSETRWPRFREPTIKEGVVSCLALPLVIGNHGTAGVLNLYSRTRPFEESDEQVGNKFALQASAAVANARAFTKAQDLIEQLQEALESRDLIGQAKGIIEVREHCGPEEAFDQLRSMSQHRDVKLRDLAEAIVEAPDSFFARED